MANKPRFWTYWRWRVGLFTEKEVKETVEIAFEEGKRTGYNEAMEKLPKALAEIAQERLQRLLGEKGGKK